MAAWLEYGLSNAVMATLLALAAFALSRLLRRPAVAHALWLIVLLKLVTPPIVPVSLPWFVAAQEEVPTTTLLLAAVDVDAPALEAAPLDPVDLPAGAGLEHAAASDPGLLSASWSAPLLWLWLAGSLCHLAWIVRGVVRFRCLLRNAWLADADTQGLTRELAERLRLTRHPLVWLVPGRVSPMLWALVGQPRLVLPAELLQRLEREQLRTILLHELVHWRRRDHRVRLLEALVLVTYWWHPAAWWARAELREAEEQCCDAWVVDTLADSERTYALALLETVAFLSHARLLLPAPASGIGRTSQLRRRLTMIMNEHRRKSMTWIGCAAMLIFALVLLPLIPVRAQQPPEKKEGKGALVIGNLELVLDGQGSPDQEAMELLQRALKILAARKQAQGGQGGLGGQGAPTASPAHIKKVKEMVEALTKQVEHQRRELAHTEAKLHEAMRHLAMLQGKTPGAGAPFHLELHLQGDPGKKGLPQQAQGWLPGEFQLRLGDGKAIVVTSGKKQSSPEELKTRVERLQRELEELRRELQSRQPSPEKREDGNKK
jgi:beta-lactamase regulating signal transducer with metallopeptidase domain